VFSALAKPNPPEKFIGPGIVLSTPTNRSVWKRIQSRHRIERQLQDRGPLAADIGV
jgi:hypothetical protein